MNILIYVDIVCPAYQTPLNFGFKQLVQLNYIYIQHVRLGHFWYILCPEKKSHRERNRLIIGVPQIPPELQIHSASLKSQFRKRRSALEDSFTVQNASLCILIIVRLLCYHFGKTGKKIGAWCSCILKIEPPPLQSGGKKLILSAWLVPSSPHYQQ